MKSTQTSAHFVIGCQLPGRRSERNRQVKISAQSTSEAISWTKLLGDLVGSH